jgi:hypothetical protein
MNPITATAIADSVSAGLPTRAMVNAIWTASAVRLTYIRMAADENMLSTADFVKHNQAIQLQLAQFNNPTGPDTYLIAGHKKDVVICKALEDSRPYPSGHGDRVAIYGWCMELHPDNSWTVVQGLNPQSHNSHYADYSHGIRLVGSMMTVDGEQRAVADVLCDPALAALISDEGPISAVRYPGT